MKINWGTAIVLVFVGFITFILYFVVKMNTQEQYSHDLVTDEYYKKELAFQEEIDAQNLSKSLKEDIVVEVIQEGLKFTFPREIIPEEITGAISMYRPSNKKLDFDLPIELTESSLVIPKKDLLEGRWDITVSWKYKGDVYLFKKSITY